MSITDSWLAGLDNPPDIWGEGTLFAYSGLDGQTNVASGFVGTFDHEPYDLLFHTQQRRRLQLRLPSGAQVRLAVSDGLVIDTPQGPLCLAYRSWHTLCGLRPTGVQPYLAMEDGTPAVSSPQGSVSVDEKHGDALALVSKGRGFALSYGRTGAEATQRARDALTCEPSQVLSDRLAFYRRLPSHAIPRWDRLLKKAFSVSKVNALSAEGVIGQHWSTPDRVPHRDMWLWDSVFHTLLMNRIQPQVAWEYLKSVLETQHNDGLIAHHATPEGQTSAITQPPLLAWGVWENYQALGDRETLAYALPRLEAYLRWDMEHRDRNDNELLEWHLEGTRQCRSGESGLDNSPRFDDCLVADAVDFSVFIAQDMAYLARIARELGETSRGEAWEQRSESVSAAIYQTLWDQKRDFYCDRSVDGALKPLLAVSGFMPLLLKSTPREHVTRLRAQLRDPERFAAAFPVPTVALSEPTWSTDMWRGPTWVNLNYLIIRGLRQHGLKADASWLRERTLHHVEKYYRRFGILFEFYDAKDRMPPTQCDRKGPKQPAYDIRTKMDSIRDYHWTAAVTALLLLEDA